MKTLFTCITLFVVTLVTAQNPITKEVGDFTEVKVYDRIVVNLVKSTENKVIITGEDASQVNIVNVNGVLKVKMDFDLIFDGNKTFVHVHYNNLQIIDGNEGAVITANELIVQDFIEIKMQEGAVVKVGLQVKEAHMRAVTGGVIEASGQAKMQKIKVNTGGRYEGRNLQTETSEVLVQAGGVVEAYATKLADLTIRAGGDIDIYGNPSQVKRKRTFGGRIRIL